MPLEAVLLLLHQYRVTHATVVSSYHAPQGFCPVEALPEGSAQTLQVCISLEKGYVAHQSSPNSVSICILGKVSKCSVVSVGVQRGWSGATIDQASGSGNGKFIAWHLAIILSEEY